MGKMKYSFSALAITMAIVLVGTWGFAGGRWDKKGYGFPGRGYRSYSNLSPERRTELHTEQEKFFKETAKLRRELYQKRLELRGLLVALKAEPEKVKARQREACRLERKLQEKALAYRMANRELVPREDFYRGPRGYGYDYRPGYGKARRLGTRFGAPGGYGVGDCWRQP